MPYDAQHALEHPEGAAWALGALDPDDAAEFGEHLQFCDRCQAEVAEFAPVANSLALAAPAAEPPDDLEYKTLAAVQYAVMAEGRTEPEAATPASPALTIASEPKPNSTSTASRWWHLHCG